MGSPYNDTIIFQEETLNKMISLIKNYIIGGNGTGITVVPSTDNLHLQIQNAIKLSVDNEEQPGKLIITDESKSENNKVALQVGNVLEFYTDSKVLNEDRQKAGSIAISTNVTNNNYTKENTQILKIKGFDDQGNYKALNTNISVYDTGLSYDDNGSGIITGRKVRGAVFNDYAEYRQSNEKDPGLCVIETGKGDLIKSTQRLQLGANIISDTFGFSIGQSEQYDTPIAVCGRVLAIPADPISLYTPGAAVCSAPEGKISVMTREEIKEWPDAIIGYVSEIPTYEVWGTDNIKVNGRIWIKIK